MTGTHLSCSSIVSHSEKENLGRLNRLLIKSLNRLLECMDTGALQIRFPSGQTAFFGQKNINPEAQVYIHNYRMVRKLLFEGDVGLAKSYIDGDWDTSDLTTVLSLGPKNMENIENKILGHPLYRMRNFLQHLFRGNSRSGSRRNIAGHYDLGNDFYKLWLDPTMTYSSALFVKGESDLKSGQLAKYRKIAHELKLAPGHRVLEIGCGWGGFSEFAAKEFGCRVEGITISKEQFDYSRKRISRAGLNDLVEIRFQDYRDLEGQYDRVVSIEMLEAVGKKNWPVYFRILQKCLNPLGRALIQTILISEKRFDDYRKKADFIQLYVFPGGMLPCMKIIRQQLLQSEMSLDGVFFFGSSYAETLKLWRKNFQQSRTNIEKLGFDKSFHRLWNYYLSYCETGFRTGVSDVVMLNIVKN